VHLLGILAVYLLGILLHCSWFKDSLQALTEEVVWARAVRG
jgi:hypothetical protein